MSAHPIVHVDISTANRQESVQFYKNLFGWQIEDMPQFNYATFSAGEGSPGGGFEGNGEVVPQGTTLVYVQTDDIEASLRQVEALGGKTLIGRTEIPGMGWWAQFSDPSGTRMALYTPPPPAA